MFLFRHVYNPCRPPMEIALIFILHETFLRITKLILIVWHWRIVWETVQLFPYSYRLEILITTYKWRSTHISTHHRCYLPNVYCRKKYFNYICREIQNILHPCFFSSTLLMEWCHALLLVNWVTSPDVCNYQRWI